MACDAFVTSALSLCAPCFANIHFITAPFCRTCGVPFAYEAQRGIAGICPSCLEHPPSFHTARAALAYDAHSRALVLPFKHADRTELARLFAPLLARAASTMLKNANLLIPVPLHRARLRHRGFNQSALLAKQLSRLTRLPTLLDALQRTRPTPPLGPLDAAARRAALRGTIQLRPGKHPAIAGRHIVLVDDVMTSGATANACSDALLHAGATRIDVAVVARVPDPELERS